ncbi:MAG TPA: hypothetical protein VLF87_00980 [Patescibacteria group bacterium]|nr:hypothetical protein [Patescibacteria group bacterium]
MLEFIVLGQVPGTNLQVTFGDVVGILMATALLFAAYQARLHRHKLTGKLAGLFKNLNLTH